MPTIRITKKFVFEMAHALYNYDGLCRNIHGHSYILFVTVKGTPINDNSHKKNGMVMDFSDFKQIVKKHIVDVFDHSILLYNLENTSLVAPNSELFERSHIVDFQPTCENLIVYFAKTLQNKFPETVKLHAIKLHETENSYAEWYADDQK
jgi:6-pyruvoyltetrahydropterin/6-carboxytetrahydropterin synthase